MIDNCDWCGDKAVVNFVNTQLVCLGCKEKHNLFKPKPGKYLALLRVRRPLKTNYKKSYALVMNKEAVHRQM